MHFQVAKGTLEISAPGRLDRRAAAAGEILPMRMQLPGKETPAVKLVVCLDKSGSMKGPEYRTAAAAAQAIALATQAAGGEVIGILFDDAAVTTRAQDARALFTDPNDLIYGSTAFTFLGDVWRRWPDHHVLVITDGDGDAPTCVLPRDKKRTSVILIPPNMNDQPPRAFADRVVVLNDLNSLASVLALLSPRSWLSA